MFAKRGLFAKVVALVTVIYPQIVVSEGFTSADVLSWDSANQDTMFQTSVTMIGVVASRMPEHAQIAQCVNGWYWDGAAPDPNRNNEIRKAMQRFPEYHPQTVILAVVEKACGKF